MAWARGFDTGGRLTFLHKNLSQPFYSFVRLRSRVIVPYSPFGPIPRAPNPMTLNLSLRSLLAVAVGGFVVSAAVAETITFKRQAVIPANHHSQPV